LGETRVDLFHLLEDLRDAYAGPLEETILTEIVANALDSGASAIAFATDPVLASLTVSDNGRGMLRRELARYHDVAASTKRKGEGIGFAGVGIKLGLLACRSVVTESRRGASHVATTWGLSSRHRAPWKWTPPAGLIASRGTAVCLHLSNVLSPLLDGAYVEQTIRRHFATLFDPSFDALLAEHGRRPVAVSIDGRALARAASDDRRAAPLEVRLARKRKPSAVGYLHRHDAPVADDDQGIAISTLGKVIARGWDWLGVTPSSGTLVTGLVEVPALAAALTLNKAAFVRTGSGGALYLAYRKALQEGVSRHLAAWGDLDRGETTPAPKPIGLREIEHVLESLTDSFPMLGSLVDRKRGGQKELPIGGGDVPASGPGVRAREDESAAPPDGAPADGGAGENETPLPPGSDTPPFSESADEPVAEPPAHETLSDQTLSTTLGGRRRRPARFGLRLAFAHRPDDVEIARLVESTVTVNTAHPAYARAQAARAAGYHIAVSVALALASIAVEPGQHHAFVTSFLAKWGEVTMPGSSGRASRKRPRSRKARSRS
jgi:hypothetical protein